MLGFIGFDGLQTLLGGVLISHTHLQLWENSVLFADRAYIWQWQIL